MSATVCDTLPFVRAFIESLPPSEEVHPDTRGMIRIVLGDIDCFGDGPAMYWQAVKDIRTILAREEQYKSSQFPNTLHWCADRRRWVAAKAPQ
jgi:hypothetical protein